MAKCRVSGGKRLDRELLTTADGAEVCLDLYMVKTIGKFGGAPTTEFVAVCDAAQVEHRGGHLDEVMAEARRRVRAYAEVQWEDWLLVTVSEDIRDRDSAGNLFSNRRPTSTRMVVELDVESIQIARGATDRWREHPREHRVKVYVNQGLPQVGVRENGTVRSLVRDTPETRAALVAIRGGFYALDDRLRALLAPERVDTSLKEIAAGERLMLPAGSEP